MNDGVIAAVAVTISLLLGEDLSNFSPADFRGFRRVRKRRSDDSLLKMLWNFRLSHLICVGLRVSFLVTIKVNHVCRNITRQHADLSPANLKRENLL